MCELDDAYAYAYEGVRTVEDDDDEENLEVLVHCQRQSNQDTRGEKHVVNHTRNELKHRPARANEPHAPVQQHTKLQNRNPNDLRHDRVLRRMSVLVSRVLPMTTSLDLVRTGAVDIRALFFLKDGIRSPGTHLTVFSALALWAVGSKRSDAVSMSIYQGRCDRKRNTASVDWPEFGGEDFSAGRAVM